MIIVIIIKIYDNYYIKVISIIYQITIIILAN
jgi:hypothetical protein